MILRSSEARLEGWRLKRDRACLTPNDAKKLDFNERHGEHECTHRLSAWRRCHRHCRRQRSPRSPRVVMEEMMVPSDPGIEIYVRNKRPADMTTFRPERTVLYVHGATYPASTAFDLQLGGLSWMDYMAARGYDVYLLDLRGYGKSTRPKEMYASTRSQSADRARRHRRQGYRRRGRLHPQAPQSFRASTCWAGRGAPP